MPARSSTGTNVSVGVRSRIGKPTAHVDFSARTTFIDSDGDTTNSGNVDHATAVVGQVASNGVAQPAAEGVAPNVNVLVYSTVDSAPSATHDIVDAASRNARLNNHSYGPANLTTFGDYQTISATWDDALRTGNLDGRFSPATKSLDNAFYTHIDFVVGMKNGLCIEATSGSASAGNPTAVPPVPAQPGLASFAKHGPMKDGRVKPDLVAFGDGVALDQGTQQHRPRIPELLFQRPPAPAWGHWFFSITKMWWEASRPRRHDAKRCCANRPATRLHRRAPMPSYGFRNRQCGREAVRLITTCVRRRRHSPYVGRHVGSGARRSNVHRSPSPAECTAAEGARCAGWIPPGNPAAAGGAGQRSGYDAPPIRTTPSTFRFR